MSHITSRTEGLYKVSSWHEHQEMGTVRLYHDKDAGDYQFVVEIEYTEQGMANHSRLYSIMPGEIVLNFTSTLEGAMRMVDAKIERLGKLKEAA